MIENHERFIVNYIISRELLIISPKFEKHKFYLFLFNFLTSISKISDF